MLADTLRNGPDEELGGAIVLRASDGNHIPCPMVRSQLTESWGSHVLTWCERNRTSKQAKEMTIAPIWFSRHKPTDKQKEEVLEKTGSNLLIFPSLSDAASKSINTTDDLRDVLRDMRGAYLKFPEYESKVMFFGVFATPIQWVCMEYALDQAQYGPMWGAELWSAWNVQRSEEVGERTFKHREFLHTGMIDFSFANKLVNYYYA